MKASLRFIGSTPEREEAIFMIDSEGSTYVDRFVLRVDRDTIYLMVERYDFKCHICGNHVMMLLEHTSTYNDELFQQYCFDSHEEKMKYMKLLSWNMSCGSIFSSIREKGLDVDRFLGKKNFLLTS